jgi:hypothetical protein
VLDWRQLVRLPEAELARLDVAAVNLACAADLPNAGPIDVPECLRRLDHYAEGVQRYTEPRLSVFRQRPAVYDHSEGIFRVVCLVAVLQRQFGVRYNPAKIPDDAPFGPPDSFIHGALLGEWGTCATLPVVYAAVGRRLGYPLRLVSARSHCFVRWGVPGGERFNIEVNAKGTDAPPDDHYRKGRYEVTPEQERAFCFLRSKTPRMELAYFMAQRAHCWLDLGRHKEAAESFAWAWVLGPDNQLSRRCTEAVLDMWADKLDALRARDPRAFPGFREVSFPPRRRYPAPIPVEMERYMLYYEWLEESLTAPRDGRGWWEPPRWPGGVRAAAVPAMPDVPVAQPTARKEMRMYDPITGRWTTEDPIGFDAGDSNLDRYVGNSPTNYTDPTGLDPDPASIARQWKEVEPLIKRKQMGLSVGTEGEIKIRAWYDLQANLRDGGYDSSGRKKAPFNEGEALRITAEMQLGGMLVAAPRKKDLTDRLVVAGLKAAK